MTKSVGTTFFYTAFCKSNLSIMSEIPKLNFPCVPNFVTRNLESVAHTPHPSVSCGFKYLLEGDI